MDEEDILNSNIACSLINLFIYNLKTGCCKKINSLFIFLFTYILGVGK